MQKKVLSMSYDDNKFYSAVFFRRDFAVKNFWKFYE